MRRSASGVRSARCRYGGQARSCQPEHMCAWTTERIGQRSSIRRDPCRQRLMGISRCIVPQPVRAGIMPIASALLTEMAERERVATCASWSMRRRCTHFYAALSRLDGYVCCQGSTPSTRSRKSGCRDISCIAYALRLLRRKLPMVHRHPTLHRILGLVFLCITVVLMFMSASPAWPSARRFCF
jgi:hypothetical protein